MYYGNIIYYDIANGFGCRTSLFVSGCENQCEHCFNPETWDFHYGKLFDENAKEKILTSLQHKHINGLTILGGEPLHPKNQKDVAELITQVKNAYPTKTIWIYTGYTYEYLQTHMTDELSIIFNNIDVLIDGPFVESKKSLRLPYRGSTNQRIIDMKQTRTTNNIILYDKYISSTNES